MPLYPPRNEPVRKKEILKKREQELHHAIEHHMPQDRIEKAAEKLRFARLKLYKGIIEQFRYDQSTDVGAKPGAKAERELEKWEGLSVDEIISMYKQGDA